LLSIKLKIILETNKKIKEFQNFHSMVCLVSISLNTEYKKLGK